MAFYRSTPQPQVGCDLILEIEWHGARTLIATAGYGSQDSTGVYLPGEEWEAVVAVLAVMARADIRLPTSLKSVFAVHGDLSQCGSSASAPQAIHTCSTRTVPGTDQAGLPRTTSCVTPTT